MLDIVGYRQFAIYGHGPIEESIEEEKTFPLGKIRAAILKANQGAITANLALQIAVIISSSGVIADTL